jgi:hypothetical protein
VVDAVAGESGGAVRGERVGLLLVVHWGAGAAEGLAGSSQDAAAVGLSLFAERVVVVVLGGVAPVDARTEPAVACGAAAGLVALAVAGGALDAGDGPRFEVPLGGFLAVGLAAAAGCVAVFTGAEFAFALRESLGGCC